MSAMDVILTAFARVSGDVELLQTIIRPYLSSPCSQIDLLTIARIEYNVLAVCFSFCFFVESRHW